MSNVANIDDFRKRNLPLTDAAWEQYLQTAQTNTIEAILEQGRRVYEYYLECQQDRTRGGSVFEQNAKAWLGLSKGAVSQWKTIGEKADELFTQCKQLPESHRTIYEIASLPDDVRREAFENGTIHPDVTQRELTQFKRELKGTPPKESTKPEGAVMWRHFIGASTVAPNWSDMELRSGQNNGGVRDLIEKAYGKAIPRHVVPGSKEANDLLAAVRAVYEKEYPSAPSVAAATAVITPTDEVSIDGLIGQLSKLLPDEILKELNPQNGLPSFIYAGIVQNRGRIKAMLEKLEKKEHKESAQILLAVLDYQTKVFEEVVKATRPKYIKALEAKLQKELEVQKAKTERITEASIKLPSSMMSQKEVKIIKGVLHPDRIATLTPEKMSAAFQIFQRVYG